MDDQCCSVPSAGCESCELPSPTLERVLRMRTACPVCNQPGKPVQRQTVKALLSITLRETRNVEYLFCRTADCPVVYFAADGSQNFETGQIRERVYQKEPAAEDVFVCYCFKHTVGELGRASAPMRVAIQDDINAGIRADQCACDLRNPQGSCCLGNVRSLIKQLDESAETAAR